MKLSIDELSRYVSAMTVIDKHFSVKCRTLKSPRQTIKEVSIKTSNELAEIVHASFQLAAMCHKITTALGDVQLDLKIEERSE